MKLNVLNDYNTPANGEDIFYVYLDEYKKSYKAFAILPRVIVIPEILGDSANNVNTNMNNYYKNEEQKSKYLAQVYTVLKRLNQIARGNKLLSFISKSIPLSPIEIKNNKKNLKFDSSNTIVTSKDPIPSNFDITNIKDYTLYQVSLIISPKHLSFAEVQKPAANQVLYSSKQFLDLIPDLSYKSTYKGKVYYIDPVIDVAKKLFLALRKLYNFYNLDDKVEEMIVTEKLLYKGSAREWFSARINSLANTKLAYLGIFRLLQNVDVSKKDKDSKTNAFLYKCYTRKYLLSWKKGKSLNIDKAKIEELSAFLNLSFSTSKFIKDFNLVDVDYDTENGGILDVANTEHYSLKEGILLKDIELPEHVATRNIDLQEIDDKITKQYETINIISKRTASLQNTLSIETNVETEITDPMLEDSSDETVLINNDEVLETYS